MAKAKRRSKELRELRRFKLAHKYETCMMYNATNIAVMLRR